MGDYTELTEIVLPAEAMEVLHNWHLSLVSDSYGDCSSHDPAGSAMRYLQAADRSKEGTT